MEMAETLHPIINEELEMAGTAKAVFAESNHIGMHPEVTKLLPSILKKIDPSNLTQYGSINIALEPDQTAGKANIAKIPREENGDIRDGVQIVYAPRVDPMGKRLKAGGYT